MKSKLTLLFLTSIAASIILCAKATSPLEYFEFTKVPQLLRTHQWLNMELTYHPNPERKYAEIIDPSSIQLVLYNSRNERLKPIKKAQIRQNPMHDWKYRAGIMLDSFPTYQDSHYKVCVERLNGNHWFKKMKKSVLIPIGCSEDIGAENGQPVTLKQRLTFPMRRPYVNHQFTSSELEAIYSLANK